MPLYSDLERLLTELRRRVDAVPRAPDGHPPPVFGAELLVANSNRGPALLDPRTLDAVEVFLDRFAAQGVTGVTISVNYPVLLPDFDGSAEYLEFYESVAAAVRARHMALFVEENIVFAGTPFAQLDVDYSGLTFEALVAGRRRMAQAIVDRLAPDYLLVLGEPDTYAKLTGLEALERPDGAVDLVRRTLSGLERRKTRIAAGTGSWSPPEYAERLLEETSLDALSVHVYPVTKVAAANLVEMVEIARAHGKGVVVDEAWLYKTTLGGDDAGQGMAEVTEVFRRDAYSFWEPLDIEFLETMSELVRRAGIEYFSPFWTTFFFAYLEYDEETASLPYAKLAAALNPAAWQSARAGRFTDVGRRWEALVRGS